MQYLYRMTHINNLPHILKYGVTNKTSANSNPSYHPIGNSRIIGRRDATIVHTIDEESFNLGDYIPFYFYARMPMLYNIQHGYNVEKIEAEDIVYLILDFKRIIQDLAPKFFFSDGHAVNPKTKFYGQAFISKIEDIIDKEAVLSNDWGSDYVVRERKQAEFFISDDIPPHYIERIICYNERSRDKIMQLQPQCRIMINPKAYY